MKLEVGQFIRTKDGYISQYKYYDTTNMGKLLCIPLSNGTFANIEDIVKASYNIVDILEVGDILVDDTNRKLEILLIDNELMVRNTGLIYDNNYYLPIKSIAIKSVITHEQMEQMAYKVEE